MKDGYVCQNLYTVDIYYFEMFEMFVCCGLKIAKQILCKANFIFLVIISSFDTSLVGSHESISIP